MPEHRFPPPWSIEELESCFIVTDNAGQKLAYEDEPGREQHPTLTLAEAMDALRWHGGTTVAWRCCAWRS
jgi:hypothetical protein